jgi:hypothetical protein
MRRLELTGRRFGRLVVLGIAETLPYGTKWLCLCDCGAKKAIYGSPLHKGLTVSCGCFHSEEVAKRMLRHGGHRRGRRLPEHRIWGEMIQRCLNKKNKSYKRYGGRGITIDLRWRRFENFLEDMGRRPAPHLTVEHKDNDGPYAKWNCVWATRKEQANNTRRSRREATRQEA